MLATAAAVKDAAAAHLRWNCGVEPGHFGGSGGQRAGSLPLMSSTRPPFSHSRAWQHTTPGALTDADPSCEEADLAARSVRIQPPLQEVLHGLDARELEGETLFDQLFGPQPDSDPRLPRL